MQLLHTQPRIVVRNSTSSQQRPDSNSFGIYQDEKLSMEAFRRFRVQEGVVCKKCGCNEYYWLSNKEQFQCKKCKFRTTLRSGSILENSKLPYSYLFIAVHLLLKTGNKLSTEQLQHHTGHKYFEPLWYLLRKIKDELGTAQQTRLMLNFIEVVQDNKTPEKYPNTFSPTNSQP